MLLRNHSIPRLNYSESISEELRIKNSSFLEWLQSMLIPIDFRLCPERLYVHDKNQTL